VVVKSRLSLASLSPLYDTAHLFDPAPYPIINVPVLFFLYRDVALAEDVVQRNRNRDLVWSKPANAGHVEAEFRRLNSMRLKNGERRFRTLIHYLVPCVWIKDFGNRRTPSVRLMFLPLKLLRRFIIWRGL
jgi:hypothetical protein